MPDQRRDFRAFVRAHVASLALPRHREIDIVEELAAQLEDAHDARLAAGLSDEEAWSEVQRHLPEWRSLAAALLEAEPVVVQLAQPPRDVRAGSAMQALTGALRDLIGVGVIRDLRSSVRLLVKDRGFTVTTVLTLALCLGAHAAIFATVYLVLLRPLPVPDAHRLVVMGDVYPTLTPNDILSNTVPAYFDRRETISTLAEQALFTSWFDTITFDGTAQEVRGLKATPTIFRVLQVAPALGRAFTDADGESGADQKIILSHGLWQRLFAGDPGAIGREVRLGWTGRPYTIVGVMPRGFSFFDRGSDGHARAGENVEFWLPLAFSPAQRSDDARTRYGFYHIGRLQPAVTVAQVQAQIDALTADTFRRFPALGLAELGMHTVVTPLQDALTRDVRATLYLLWAGAAFVLLIGTLNITNLSLARSSARARELATRLALGAGRVRVARQLILESVVVAVIGGAAGIAVGAGILRELLASGMTDMPNAAALAMNRTTVVWTLVIAVVVGVLMGLVPASMLRRVRLNQVLADGSRRGTSGRAARLVRRGLVVAQVAVSVVLLVGAVLLLTSFRNLVSVEAGFDPARVTTATIFPPPSRYADNAAVVALSDRILAAVRTLPGVEAAGLTSNIASSGRTTPSTVSADDRQPSPGEPPLLPSVVSVTPGYFETMATRLVRGRYFADSDNARSLRVAIVDERLAARLWPADDPLGKRLRRGDSEPYTVVGVVRDVRFDSPAGPAESVGAAYFPHTQAPPLGRLRWIAIKAADAAPVASALRAAVRSIDPDLPLGDLQTMTERTSRLLLPQALAMGLASMFGIVALLLSALGLYGVLAYIVARRTREIGIRLALGSTAADIFRLVFSEGLTLVLTGVTLGVAGAVVVGRALEGHVFGVTPTDPRILSAVAVSTGIIALLACVSPARRATRIDPLRVLSAD